MNTKTTKTLVFAALIAAMILPFGGMQSAFATHDAGAEHVQDGTHQSTAGDAAAEKLAVMLGVLADLNEEIIECADPTVIAGLEAKKVQVLAEIAALTA